MFKFLVISTTLFLCSFSLKCIDKDNADGADCPIDKVNCVSPTWTDYTGYATYDQACGVCPDGADATPACTQCATAADNCNAILSGDDITSFKCYTWAYNTADTVFKKGAETDCKTKTADKIAVKCNKPLEGAAANYVVANGGCGPCRANDDKCEECDGEKCNSGASHLSLTVLPALLAFFYIFM